MTEVPVGIDPGTQVLDLSGNHLNVLVKERFLTLGLVNLQKAFLSRCHIAQIQDRAFARLTNLVELDLSENALTTIPASMFHDVPALIKISLAKNPIMTIEGHTFVPLQYLAQLDLSECLITTIKKSAFQGLKSLAWLRLNNNNLTTFDPEASQLPQNLNELSLHGNNWVCDCNLRELRTWFAHHTNVPMSVEPKCRSPKNLEGESIKYISKDELACGPVVQSLSSQFAEVQEGEILLFITFSYTCIRLYLFLFAKLLRITLSGKMSWSIIGHIPQCIFFSIREFVTPGKTHIM
jgi:hypothetical protein